MAEEISFLNQMADVLEKTVPKLEEAYSRGDAEGFNRIKRFVLDIQNKIEAVLK